MTGHVPREFIEQLLAVTDLVELIGAHLQLRRAGAEYKALCPFHEEQTPSFQVSPRKQFYYCFGCGAAGDAIRFLMRYRNLDFPTAVEELAHRAGLDLPRSDGPARGAPRADTELLYTLLERAARHYREQLQRHRKALDYLEQRGLHPATVRKFELGFAPAAGTLLSLLRKEGVSAEQLRRCGLSSEDGRRDRFRNRVIFPIRDPRGRVVALGGRLLDSGQPKYLNSPETPVFHKGRELYGFRQAPGTPRPERYYLVEGYLDVLMLDQYDVPGAVAALGTAVTRTHLARLLRACPKLTVCLDGDAAGRRAARKVLEQSLPLWQAGQQIDFLFLPEGEDPDSFVRHHGAAAVTGKARRRPLSAFLLHILLEDADLNNMEGRGAVIARARESLRQIRDPILRKGLIRELAEATHTPEQELELLVSSGTTRYAAAAGTPPPAPPSRPSRGDPPKQLLTRAIGLLLLHPEFAGDVEEPQLLAELEQPGIDFLVQLLEFLQQHPDSNCASILHHWQGSRYANRLQELAATGEPLLEEQQLRREFLYIMEYLRHKLARQYVQAAGTRITELLRDAEEERSERQHRSLQDLQETQRRLKAWLGQPEGGTRDARELQQLQATIRRQVGTAAPAGSAPPAAAACAPPEHVA